MKWLTPIGDHAPPPPVYSVRCEMNGFNSAIIWQLDTADRSLPKPTRYYRLIPSHGGKGNCAILTGSKKKAGEWPPFSNQWKQIYWIFEWIKTINYTGRKQLAWGLTGISFNLQNNNRTVLFLGTWHLPRRAGLSVTTILTSHRTLRFWQMLFRPSLKRIGKEQQFPNLKSKDSVLTQGLATKVRG